MAETRATVAGARATYHAARAPMPGLPALPEWMSLTRRGAVVRARTGARVCALLMKMVLEVTVMKTRTHQ